MHSTELDLVVTKKIKDDMKLKGVERVGLGGVRRRSGKVNMIKIITLNSQIMNQNYFFK